MLVRDVADRAARAGDILVTPGTGAYGYVMANNYNGSPRPAIILVSDGAGPGHHRARELRRRGRKAPLHAAARE